MEERWKTRRTLSRNGIFRCSLVCREGDESSEQGESNPEASKPVPLRQQTSPREGRTRGRDVQARAGDEGGRNPLEHHVGSGEERIWYRRGGGKKK